MKVSLSPTPCPWLAARARLGLAHVAVDGGVGRAEPRATHPRTRDLPTESPTGQMFSVHKISLSGHNPH